MPPVEKSPQQWVHETFLEILRDAEESLRVGNRPIRIVDTLPDNAPQATAVPMIYVERPTENGRGPWGGGYERIELLGMMLLVDACRANERGPNESDERLERIFTKVNAALRAEPNLRLAFLHVHASFLRTERQDPETLNNNMRGLPVVYRIPVIVEHGVLFEG